MTYTEPSAAETAAAWSSFCQMRRNANHTFDALTRHATRFAATLREWHEAAGHTNEKEILTRATEHLQLTADAAGELADHLNAANDHLLHFAVLDSN